MIIFIYVINVSADEGNIAMLPSREGNIAMLPSSAGNMSI